MIRLALDLGTKCGWAASVNGSRIGGTWLLTTEKDRKRAASEGLDRRCDPRFGALLDCLYEFRYCYGTPDTIAFEDVQFSEYTLQTQLWSSLRSAVWAFKYLRPDVRIYCLDTAGLKKWGTGHGGATKGMMGAWLVKRHPDLYIKNPKPTENCFVLGANPPHPEVDDNQVDAQHLLDYSILNFA